MPPTAVTRPIDLDDAPALVDLLRVDRELLDVAFRDLGLHRVQAETLLHNVASQRVLARNGFVRYGTAPQYLRIAGRWQDHAMFQALDPAAADR